jgi:glycosyltransferase involved in cell wall biosynthesis
VERRDSGKLAGVSGEDLTIGIDARAAAEVPAGRGRFVRELLLALAARDDPHRYRLYVRRAWDAPLDERFTQVEIGLPDPLWHVAAAYRASACDVFLSTNSYLTAWLLRVPCAVVVYDLIAFRPEARPQRRAALIERGTIRPAIRRSARLICISHATERDLVEMLPDADGRTAVVPLAADDRFAATPSRAEIEPVIRRHGVEDGFVLATGTLEPRKNLVRLIQAHGGLPPELTDAYPLLVVGPAGWEQDEIAEAAAGHESSVVFTGFVPDEELAALYAACTVFCYPSLYEGFGLPILEAMQAGAPTITSNVSSLPEVGGNATMYVNPVDEDSIRGALERLLTTPAERAELSERGRRQARAFSWERTAAGVLEQLKLAQAASKRS